MVSTPTGSMANRHGAIKVLIVDDHPLVRAGVRLLLAEGGVAEVVGEAADGRAAVLMAEAHRPDVVLMDCVLPELSGADATKMLLAAHPWLKVLGFSSLDDVTSVRELLAAGAAGYARKGSSATELACAVSTVAEGGRYLAPQLATAVIAAERRKAEDEVRLATLSRREAEVLRRIAQGRPVKEVAGALALSPRTLETYRQRAMNKLKLHSRSELVLCAARFGWLRGD
jgi:DNA-binding NarL/FixJ family response regulator